MNTFKLSDVELCEEHSKWLGKVRYHNAAEGQAWFSESAERSHATVELQNCKTAMAERNIEFEEKDRKQIYKKGDEIVLEK